MTFSILGPKSLLYLELEAHEVFHLLITLKIGVNFMTQIHRSMDCLFKLRTWQATSKCFKLLPA